MKNYPHIRSAVYGQPWAINREWLEAIADIVEIHASGAEPKAFIPKEKRGRRCMSCKTGVLRSVMVPGAWGPVPSGRYNCPSCGTECLEDDLPPYEIINGVAILPLSGPLFPKANLMTKYSGATSYQEWTLMFSQAMTDPDVTHLLPLSDSPGGSCLGMSEACSIVHAAVEIGTKPVYGLIDPMACSAAYGIMSQCEQLYCTESAMVGNIGTRFRLSNWDRAERNEGNDPIEIASNDIKATGTPQSLAQYESNIEILRAYFEQFKSIVARGRPFADIEAVANAKVWIGSGAVNVGLCDGVSTLEKLILKLTK